MCFHVITQLIYYEANDEVSAADVIRFVRPRVLPQKYLQFSAVLVPLVVSEAWVVSVV